MTGRPNCHKAKAVDADFVGPDHPRVRPEGSSLRPQYLGHGARPATSLQLFAFVCYNVFLSQTKKQKTVSGWGFTPDITVKLTTLPTPFNMLGRCKHLPRHYSLDTYVCSKWTGHSVFSASRRLWTLRPSDDVGRWEGVKAREEAHFVASAPGRRKP